MQLNKSVAVVKCMQRKPTIAVVGISTMTREVHGAVTKAQFYPNLLSAQDILSKFASMVLWVSVKYSSLVPQTAYNYTFVSIFLVLILS